MPNVMHARSLACTHAHTHRCVCAGALSMETPHNISTMLIKERICPDIGSLSTLQPNFF
jgi:hypothetical protein